LHFKHFETKQSVLKLLLSVEKRLTLREFALLKSFIEAFAQGQISLSRGAVQELSHLKETWARLRGWKS